MTTNKTRLSRFFEEKAAYARYFGYAELMDEGASKRTCFRSICPRNRILLKTAAGGNRHCWDKTDVAPAVRI